MDEYHAWAGCMYLRLRAAKQIRSCMDRALEDASQMRLSGRGLVAFTIILVNVGPAFLICLFCSLFKRFW